MERLFSNLADYLTQESLEDIAGAKEDYVSIRESMLSPLF